jgi:predicted RNA-binding Zn-ribbon protein involved in translation (DUF1610 family)
LKFITPGKHQQVENLLEAYRAAVNFYIREAVNDPDMRLTGKAVQRLTSTRLSYRYKNAALRQALGIVASWRSNDSKGNVPVFEGGATLSDKFVDLEFADHPGEFDLYIRLSTLNKGDRILLPTKRTAPLNKWLAMPGARLVQGCTLFEDHVIVWVEIPDLPPKDTGDIIGIDMGVCKLIATSEGQFFGSDFRKVRDKVNRRHPGSRGRFRAMRERDQFINRCVNLLPWDRLKAIGMEDLVNLKKGKKPNRSKAFRKALSPWTYRRVLGRLGEKATACRVRPVTVPAAYTSRECPECGAEDRLNRQGEEFRCVACGHQDDADKVGARNVFTRTCRTLGSVVSPGPLKPLPDSSLEICD